MMAGLSPTPVAFRAASWAGTLPLRSVRVILGNYLQGTCAIMKVSVCIGYGYSMIPRNHAVGHPELDLSRGLYNPRRVSHSDPQPIGCIEMLAIDRNHLANGSPGRCQCSHGDQRFIANQDDREKLRAVSSRISHR